MADITYQQARADFQEVLDANSVQIRFKYFTESGAASDYDDAQVLAPSGGDVWVSGCVQPVTSRYGSQEAQLLEQGRLTFNDRVIYFPCEVNTSGTWRLGIGSPSHSGAEFEKALPGTFTHNISGKDVYKKIYVRRLQFGKLDLEQ